MRTNLPVTHNEFVIPDGVTLVSTALPRTTFTYAHLNQVNAFRQFTVDGRAPRQTDHDVMQVSPAGDEFLCAQRHRCRWQRSTGPCKAGAGRWGRCG